MKIVKNILIASALLMLLWIVIIPLALQRYVSVEAIHEARIQTESRQYADAAANSIANENAPVLNRAQNAKSVVEINLDEQGEGLLKYGNVGRRQAINRDLAVAALHGRIVGDFSIPANQTWLATAKEIRKPARIEGFGSVRDYRFVARYGDIGPAGVPNSALPASFFEGDLGLVCDSFPYLAFIGRVQKEDGTFGSVFLIGPSTDVNPDRVGYGRLWIGINHIATQYGDPVSSFKSNKEGSFSGKLIQ